MTLVVAVVMFGTLAAFVLIGPSIGSISSLMSQRRRRRKREAAAAAEIPLEPNLIGLRPKTNAEDEGVCSFVCNY